MLSLPIASRNWWTCLRCCWPLIILFKNDLAHYSQEEGQCMVQQYNVDQSFPLLTVLRLKQ